jgi:hypothetical protein
VDEDWLGMLSATLKPLFAACGSVSGMLAMVELWCGEQDRPFQGIARDSIYETINHLIIVQI